MLMHPELLVRSLIERRLDVARDLERARGPFARPARPGGPDRTAGGPS